MNKLFLVALVAGIFTSSASASSKYECWMYKGGHPQWYINVYADSNSEATNKAYPKFKDLGRSGDYVKCH